MREFKFSPTTENVLILDYNTIRLQSSGFIRLMAENGVEEAKQLPLSTNSDVIDILNFDKRNTADIIDGCISEESYFKFIKGNYNDVTNRSDLTHLCNTCGIMSTQQFIHNTFIATPCNVEYNIITNNNFKPLVFDIFNISEIENCINTNKITSIFIHDIKMVVDLVLNFNIKLEGFTFFISKLGYNVTDVDGEILFSELEVYKLSEELDFKLVMIDIFNDFEEPMDISM